MQGRTGRWIAGFAVAAAALALAACGGGGGGSSSGSVAQGALQMSVTDAPACYDHVVVNVAKVRVHMNSDNTSDSDGGWKDIVPANAPVAIDLVNLTNGQLADLGTSTVPAGTYHQLRFVLAANGNYVTPVGSTQQLPLKTPSGQQSGLKIKADFEVLANQGNNVLMDFDACKSVVQTGSGTYILKPVVRLSDARGGAIQGFLDTSTFSAASDTPDVPVHGTTVSAQQDGAVVRSTIPDANGRFVLGSLPGGTYTVVISAFGHATGVVDSVPVTGTATTSLNTTTSTLVLNSSPMGTVTGTITAASGTTDDLMVSALQSVKSRQVQVTGTRVDDDTNKYTLRLPTGAPEYTTYATPSLPAFVTDTSTAGKYTIRASGEGLATKDSPLTDITSGPAVVDFSY